MEVWSAAYYITSCKSLLQVEASGGKQLCLCLWKEIRFLSLPFCLSLLCQEGSCGRTWPWQGKPLHPNAVLIMLNDYEHKPVNLWTRMKFLYKSTFQTIYCSDWELILSRHHDVVFRAEFQETEQFFLQLLLLVGSNLQIPLCISSLSLTKLRGSITLFLFPKPWNGKMEWDWG